MIYDRDIREPLFMYLEETVGKVRFFEEKKIGEAVADAVMVTSDSIYGIEIKSDADTYTRLSKQVKYYDKYFDRNYVVVGSRHAMHIEEHVPEYWGIITVEMDEHNHLDFYMLRKPQVNPRSDIKNKICLLWRPELAHIQQLNSMHAYAYKSKAFVRGKILEAVPEDILNRQISDELFERDYSTILGEINEFRTAHGQKRRKKTKRKNIKHT